MAPLLLLWPFVRGLRRGGLALGAFTTYLGVLSLLAHKEARFLVPVLPLFVVVAAGPAWALWETLKRWRWGRAGAVGVYALSSLAAATVQRPVGLHPPFVDAYVYVGRQPGLTRLVVAGLKPFESGGRFYLNRPVPVHLTGEEAEALRVQLRQQPPSHVLLHEGVGEGAQVLAEAGYCHQRAWGPVSLWQPCAPGGAALPR
jgi:hypothetical protein